MGQYIDSRFKRAFIVRFCIGMVIISILSSCLFFLIMPQKAANLYVSLIYTLQQAESNLIPMILAVGIFEIVLAFLFTVLFALFLSHKVGGPIFKLGLHLEKLRKGDFNLPGLKFRDGDQGQILSVKFNEMLTNWLTHLTELRYNYCKFSARMSNLEKKWPHSEEDAESSRTITRMKHDVERMQDVLDRFLL